MGKSPRKPATQEQIRLMEARMASREVVREHSNILAPQIETQIERLISAPHSSPLMRTDSTLGRVTRDKMMKELQGELRHITFAAREHQPGKKPVTRSTTPGDPVAAEGFIGGIQSNTLLSHHHLGKNAHRYTGEGGRRPDPEPGTTEYREMITSRYGTSRPLSRGERSGGGERALALSRAESTARQYPTPRNQKLVTALSAGVSRGGPARRIGKKPTPEQVRATWGSILEGQTSRMVTKRKARKARAVAEAALLGPSTSLGF